LCGWRLAAAGPPAREPDADTHAVANTNADTDADRHADPDTIVMSRKCPGLQLALR
jgi:hypothetical protein